MCSDGRTFEALVGGRCVLVEFPDRPLAVAALPVAMCLFDLICELKWTSLSPICTVPMLIQTICMRNTFASRRQKTHA